MSRPVGQLVGRPEIAIYGGRLHDLKRQINTHTDSLLDFMTTGEVIAKSINVHATLLRFHLSNDPN